MSRCSRSSSQNRSTIACKSPSSSTKISACFWYCLLIIFCTAIVHAIAFLGLIAAVRVSSVNPAVPLMGRVRIARFFDQKAVKCFQVFKFLIHHVTNFKGCFIVCQDCELTFVDLLRCSLIGTFKMQKFSILRRDLVEPLELTMTPSFSALRT